MEDFFFHLHKMKKDIAGMKRGIYNPQNEMYFFSKRNVLFLGGG